MTRKKYVEMSVIENVINFRERLSEMIVIVCENLTDKQLNMKSRYDSNTRKHHFPLVMQPCLLRMVPLDRQTVHMALERNPV
jgi:predicted RNA-binding protein Jag